MSTDIISQYSLRSLHRMEPRLRRLPPVACLDMWTPPSALTLWSTQTTSPRADFDHTPFPPLPPTHAAAHQKLNVEQCLEILSWETEPLLPIVPLFGATPSFF